MTIYETTSMPATRTTHSIEPLTTPPATPKSQTCRKRGSKKNAAAQPTSGSALNTSDPSTSRLLDHTRQTTDDWYKSSRTKKGYAGYVKSGKKWVFEWAGAQMEPDAQSSTDESEGLALAFDSLSKNTPLALRLLTAFKCDHNGKGFATAEGIRSAFKDYFERCVHYFFNLFLYLMDVTVYWDARVNSGSIMHIQTSGKETLFLRQTIECTMSRSRTARTGPEHQHRPYQCFQRI